MRPEDISRFDGETIDLNLFGVEDGEAVFVDLDAETAGALTPDNAPSQNGFIQIGEARLKLNDVENIIGTDNGERLFGGEEDGFILAGGGDDTVHPFNGDDYVDGGAGVDTLLLNAINGALTVDLKRGFANTDDQVNEITGFENVTGSNLFSDKILGDGGDNILSGGAGGDDTLKGRGGDDTLDGGADDDRLVGGKGDDELTGGEGADRFVFGRKHGEDMIKDFSFEEGDSLKFQRVSRIDNEDELMDFIECLNTDNRDGTFAELSGDDLVLRFRGTEVTLEDYAVGWDADALLI